MGNLMEGMPRDLQGSIRADERAYDAYQNPRAGVRVERGEVRTIRGVTREELLAMTPQQVAERLITDSHGAGAMPATTGRHWSTEQMRPRLFASDPQIRLTKRVGEEDLPTVHVLWHSRLYDPGSVTHGTAFERELNFEHGHVVPVHAVTLMVPRDHEEGQYAQNDRWHTVHFAEPQPLVVQSRHNQDFTWDLNHDSASRAVEHAAHLRNLGAQFNTWAVDNINGGSGPLLRDTPAGRAEPNSFLDRDAARTAFLNETTSLRGLTAPQNLVRQADTASNFIVDSKGWQGRTDDKSGFQAALGEIRQTKHDRFLGDLSNRELETNALHKALITHLSGGDHALPINNSLAVEGRRLPEWKNRTDDRSGVANLIGPLRASGWGPALGDPMCDKCDSPVSPLSLPGGPEGHAANVEDGWACECPTPGDCSQCGTPIDRNTGCACALHVR